MKPPAFLPASSAEHRLLGLGFLMVVATLALVGSWGQPLLNSHAHRQTQTAQTIKIFAEEGWHPLLPKLFCLGKPGYNLLEFPIYQSLVLGIMHVTHLPLETSGRLLSWLAALIMAAAIWETYRLILADHPLHREAGHWPFLLSTALTMASPMMFAASQWVTIEVFNNALGFWAFVLFFKFLKQKRSATIFFLFFLLATLSLAIKPNVIFALLPLFVLASHHAVIQTPGSSVPGASKRFFGLVLASVAAGALASTWYLYGEKINSQYAVDWYLNGVKISSPYGGYRISEVISFLLFNLRQSGIKGIATLLGRVLFYIIGPGTLLIVTGTALLRWSSVRNNFISLKTWVLTSLLSIGLYLTVFSGANIAHNYYQLPIIFPVYLVILLLVPCGLNRKMLAVCAVVIGLNLAFSACRLMRQDNDLKNAIAFLKTRISPGPERPEILVISNWNAATPVLCYYLDRYGRAIPPEKLSPPSLSQTADWVGVCDKTVDSTCVDRLQSEKYREFTTMGRLWICWGKKT